MASERKLDQLFQLADEEKLYGAGLEREVRGQQGAKDPSSVALGFERPNLKKKKNSEELAKRMLQSLEWDLSRESHDLARNEGVEDSREFMEGVREYTRSKAAKSITAKAIRDWASDS